MLTDVTKKNGTENEGKKERKRKKSPQTQPGCTYSICALVTFHCLNVLTIDSDIILQTSVFLVDPNVIAYIVLELVTQPRNGKYKYNAVLSRTESIRHSKRNRNNNNKYSKQSLYSIFILLL